jgi:hypothetical protein
MEYLSDLSAWSTPEDPQPSTHAIASALIAMLETRRALEHLEATQLRAGDVVVEWWRSDLRAEDETDPQRLRLVASIGDDGTVHFQGGEGRRGRVHRLDLVHRGDEDSEVAPSHATMPRRGSTSLRHSPLHRSAKHG